MSNLNIFVQKVQAPKSVTAETEYFFTVCLQWADFEIKNLRELKKQVEREKNTSTRRMLETQLRVRVQRYMHVVSSTMREIHRDKIFHTLPGELQSKVLDWVRSANGVRP